MVDFPTFGYPTSPTSAITFNSKRTQSSIAGWPGFANLGTCMVGVAKCIFPAPPLPPFRITSRIFFPDISAIIFPLASSRMIVPSGTFTIKSCPSAPWERRFFPSSPDCAIYLRTWRKSFNVFRPLSTSKITSPPLPPSPPSGPPAATKSSRRKLTCPSPPLPDLMNILALSIINTLPMPFFWFSFYILLLFFLFLSTLPKRDRCERQRSLLVSYY